MYGGTEGFGYDHPHAFLLFRYATPSQQFEKKRKSKASSFIKISI